MKSKSLSAALIGSIAAFASHTALASMLEGKVIESCNDGAEWPPYIYYERDASGKPTKEIAGFSVDLLNHFMKKYNATVNYKLLPWKNCLKQLEKGKYDVITDASWKQERADLYTYTNSFYYLTPKVFFMPDKHPEGVIGNMSGLTYCGLRGYNYADFNITSKKLDTNSKDFPSVFKKLRGGKCDGVIARHEILAGFKKIGQDLIHGTQAERIPAAKTSPFYMIISDSDMDPKGKANADQLALRQELAKAIDEGIASISQEELNSLASPYGLSIDKGEINATPKQR